MQLDEQFINRVGVAALGDQFITELQQSTDYQAVFFGGKGENSLRCFHIDPSYYTCTPAILASLAESYAGGGSMTENIDKVGGAGTGAFAKEVIDHYIEGL